MPVTISYPGFSNEADYRAAKAEIDAARAGYYAATESRFDCTVRRLAPTIRKLRENRSRRSTRKLAERLNAMGEVGPNGKKLTPSTMRRILLRLSELGLGDGPSNRSRAASDRRTPYYARLGPTNSNGLKQLLADSKRKSPQSGWSKIRPSGNCNRDADRPRRIAMPDIKLLKRQLRMDVERGRAVETQRLVLAFGQPFVGIQRPKGLRLGRKKMCFENAASAVICSDKAEHSQAPSYVEGYALVGQRDRIASRRDPLLLSTCKEPATWCRCFRPPLTLVEWRSARRSP